MEMSEREKHFIWLLGQCADAASLARMELELELEDGSRVAGIPARQEPDEDEIDGTGVDALLVFDGRRVGIAGVRSYRVTRPSQSPG